MGSASQETGNAEAKHLPEEPCARSSGGDWAWRAGTSLCRGRPGSRQANVAHMNNGNFDKCLKLSEPQSPRLCDKESGSFLQSYREVKMAVTCLAHSSCSINGLSFFPFWTREPAAAWSVGSCCSPAVRWVRDPVRSWWSLG